MKNVLLTMIVAILLMAGNGRTSPPEGWPFGHFEITDVDVYDVNNYTITQGDSEDITLSAGSSHGTVEDGLSQWLYVYASVESNGAIPAYDTPLAGEAYSNLYVTYEFTWIPDDPNYPEDPPKYEYSGYTTIDWGHEGDGSFYSSVWTRARGGISIMGHGTSVSDTDAIAWDNYSSHFFDDLTSESFGAVTDGDGTHSGYHNYTFYDPDEYMDLSEYDEWDGNTTGQYDEGWYVGIYDDDDTCMLFLLDTEGTWVHYIDFQVYAGAESSLGLSNGYGTMSSDATGLISIGFEINYHWTGL